MAYRVKEIFYSLQGEGAQAGAAAVFCRFAACNLWTGRERDRAAALCPFCDTDFVGTNGVNGGVFEQPESLARAVAELWPDRVGGGVDQPLVILTGGEPLLQVDEPLIAALHAEGLRVAVETNGTIAAPAGIDWLCVSPKSIERTVQRSGHELKLVYPQSALPPEACAEWDFEHFFLQPMDGPDAELNTDLAIRHCLAHPRWRLSLQTQKITGLQAIENLPSMAQLSVPRAAHDSDAISAEAS